MVFLVVSQDGQPCKKLDPVQGRHILKKFKYQVFRTIKSKVSRGHMIIIVLLLV